MQRFLRIWAKLPHFGKKRESFLSRLKRPKGFFLTRAYLVSIISYKYFKISSGTHLEGGEIRQCGWGTPAHFWSLVALSNLVFQELYLTENTNKGYIAHNRGITRIKSLMLDSGITLSSKIMAKFPHLTVTVKANVRFYRRQK